jgi:hypothetical protein
MEIKWTEPPAKKTGQGGARLRFVAELQKNPGVWALFRERTYPSTGYDLKKRFPNLEMTIRYVGKSDTNQPLYDIYLRWNEGETNA